MNRGRVIAAIGLIGVLAIGGLFLFNQVSAEPGCEDKGPCMLYFYTDWWEVCKLMDPIVNGLAEKYKGSFKIVRVDVGSSRGKSLAREYGCIGQPAYVLFDAAGEQVRRLLGAQTAQTFEQEIERILEKQR